MSTKFRGDFHSIFGEGECEYLCLLLKKVLMVLSNLDTIINNINKLDLFVSDVRTWSLHSCLILGACLKMSSLIDTLRIFAKQITC